MRRALAAAALIVTAASLCALWSCPFLAPHRGLLVERAGPILAFLAVLIFDLAVLMHAGARRLGLGETGRKITLLESRLADWDDSLIVRGSEEEEDS